MDKSEIRTGQADNRKKELKGLKDEGMIDLKCANCEKTLLCLQLASTSATPKSQVLTRVAVSCGLCGGFSYVEQVPGQFYPGAPSDDMAFDVFDGDDSSPEADVLFKAWLK